MRKPAVNVVQSTWKPPGEGAGRATLCAQWDPPFSSGIAGWAKGVVERTALGRFADKLAPARGRKSATCPVLRTIGSERPKGIKEWGGGEADLVG